MVCESWKAQLDTYLDGEVPEEEIRTFDAHVRNCPSCSADALYARTVEACDSGGWKTFRAQR